MLTRTRILVINLPLRPRPRAGWNAAVHGARSAARQRPLIRSRLVVSGRAAARAAHRHAPARAQRPLCLTQALTQAITVGRRAPHPTPNQASCRLVAATCPSSRISRGSETRSFACASRRRQRPHRPRRRRTQTTRCRLPLRRYACRANSRAGS